MAQYAIRRGDAPAELFIGSGIVTNLGPGTIYYADTQNVTVTSYRGALAPSATTALEGVQWFTTEAPKTLLYVEPGQTTVGQGPPGPPGPAGPGGPAGSDAIEVSDALRGALDRFYRLVAGALRYNGTEWELVNDSFSRPQNVDGVTTDANKITLDYTSIGVLHVGSFSAVPSEDLSAVGIRPVVKPAVTGVDITLRQDRTLADFASWNGTAWVLSKGTQSPFQLSGLDGGSDDYPATILAQSGLQAFYRFSDASGATITDSSGNARHGAVVSTGTTYAITSGAPVITDAGPDKAMRVATGGTNEFTLPITGITQAAFTVELWIKIPVGGTALIRDNQVSTTQGYWIGKNAATGVIQYRMGTSTTYQTTYPWANLEGTYRHVVWVKNVAATKLYIDGVLVHSGSGAPTTALATPWHLGRGGYGATTQNSQAAEVSEAATYNVELASADIREHYYAGRADGVLRVTHPDMGSTSPGGISLTPQGSAVRPVLGDSVTTGSFGVKFYDATNTLMTTPDTDQKVAITRAVTERKVDPTAFTAVINVSGDDYDAAVNADGPSSYVILGDTVGAGTVDDSIGALNGTVGAGVTLGVTGLLASDAHTAAQFDGTANGKIVFGNPGLVNTPFSAEIWFSRTGAGTVGDGTFTTLLGWGSAQGQRHILLRNEGTISVIAGGATLSPSANTALLAGTHHLVLTWDLLTERLYIDSQLVAFANTGGVAINAPLLLGENNDPSANYAFKGSLGRLALYRKTLTAAQVQQHYATGAGIVLPVDRAVGAQITFQGIFETNAPPVAPPPDQPLPTATPLPDNDLGGEVTANLHIDTYRSSIGAASAWFKRALPTDPSARDAILLNGLTVSSISYPAATSENWRQSWCDLVGVDKNTPQNQAQPNITAALTGGTTPMWLAPSLWIYVVPDDQPLRPFVDVDVSVSGWATEVNAIVNKIGGYPLPADARPDPSPDRYAYFYQPSQDRMINIYDFSGSVPATTTMQLTGTPSTGAFGLKFFYRDNALLSTATYFLQTLIAYNATAAQVKTAIDGAKTSAGATFGTNGTRPGSYKGSCVVTGGPLNVAPITINFPSVDPLQAVGFALDSTNFFLNSGTVEFSYTNAGPYDRGRLSAITTPSLDGHIAQGISGFSGTYSDKFDNAGFRYMDARWGPTATGIDQTPLIPSPEEYQVALANGTNLGHVLALRCGNCMGGPFKFVYPAKRGDGTFTRADGSMITEGALVTLPPDVDLSYVQATYPEWMPIARTLRDFGAVIYDKTGGGAEFVLRRNSFPDSAIPNAWTDLLPLYKTVGDAPIKYMRSLPWHKVEIIAPSAVLAGW